MSYSKFVVKDPLGLIKRKASKEASVSAPLAGTHVQRLQRLQVGFFGLGALILMVALADFVFSRAQETQDNAVPEAAATVASSEDTTPSDPLADAGVVPELPAEDEVEAEVGPDEALIPLLPEDIGDAPEPLPPPIE